MEMPKEEILQKVKEVLKQYDIDTEKVTDQTTIQELDIDSLDFVEMVMEMEKVFGISIPDREAESSQTVGDLVDIVKGSNKLF